MERPAHPGRLAALLLALALAVSCARAAPDSARANAVWVGRDELAAHKISGEALVRVERDPMEEVQLEVSVDEEGRVTDARPAEDLSRLPPELRQEASRPVAIAAARAWRFRPFERDNRKVAARGVISIAVLPPERLPARHVAFPPVDPAHVTITLERTACFGPCPVYSVSLRGDGTTSFTASGNTVVGGSHHYAVPPERVRALVERFRAADFWSLDSEYSASVTDMPTHRLIVDTGAQSKTVTDYAGTMMGMPAVVRALEDAVDSASDDDRWVKGNAETVPSLAAEGFDFRSAEAAKILLRAIPEAPEDVPVALLDRGVRLDPKARRLALSAAVAAGRTRVFDRLAVGGTLAAFTQAERDRLLMAAARTRSPHLVSRLLAAGADSRARDPELGSALIQAVDDPYGRIAPDADQAAVVRLLLRSGVVLEARNDIGWTALQTAYDDPPAIARLLIGAGARVDAHDKDDAPVLYLTNDEEIALLAIRAGADVGLKDDDGHDLREIARRKHWPRVEALLAARRGG